MVYFSLNVSDHLYSEQVATEIDHDALPTPVQDPSDAPNITLSLNIPNLFLVTTKFKVNVYMKRKLINM